MKLFQSYMSVGGLQQKHRSHHCVREARGGEGGPEKKPDEQIKVAFDGQGWPKERRKKGKEEEEECSGTS